MWFDTDQEVSASVSWCSNETVPWGASSLPYRFRECGILKTRQVSDRAAAAAAAAAKSLQSCLTLWDPIDGSPPACPVPGILQARTLEWVAISFSNVWKWKWKGSRSVVSNSSRLHGLQPTRLLCPWNSPGKSTGVGCHCKIKLFSKLKCDLQKPFDIRWKFIMESYLK